MMEGQLRSYQVDSGRRNQAVFKAQELAGLSMPDTIRETNRWLELGKVRKVKEGNWVDEADDSLMLTARLFRFSDKSSLVVVLVPNVGAVLTIAFGAKQWRNALEVINSEIPHPFVLETLVESMRAIYGDGPEGEQASMH